MLTLIVGPSGSGKDTLMEAARDALAADTRFRFVRRAITRPETAGGEAHEALEETAFTARHAAGAFALSWQAHGLRYGIPADIEPDIAKGRVVVANVSRQVLSVARDRYPTHVIQITAPPHLLAERLAKRARTGEDMAARLARSVSLPADLQAETIVNTGTIQEGREALVAALHRLAAVPIGERLRLA